MSPGFRRRNSSVHVRGGARWRTTGGAPIMGNDRTRVIDALRGVALFGVLLVNVLTEFRVSLFQAFDFGFGLPPLAGVTETDRVMGHVVARHSARQLVNAYGLRRWPRSPSETTRRDSSRSQRPSSATVPCSRIAAPTRSRSSGHPSGASRLLMSSSSVALMCVIVLPRRRVFVAEYAARERSQSFAASSFARARTSSGGATASR